MAFGRYWRGDGLLWRVYWLYGVAVSGIAKAVVVLAILLGWLTPAVLVGAVAATAIYAQWLLVSVWRCAPNVRTDALGIGRSVWGVLARLSTLAWALGAIAVAANLLRAAVGQTGKGLFINI
jgi:hypothetical protein